MHVCHFQIVDFTINLSFCIPYNAKERIVFFAARYLSEQQKPDYIILIFFFFFFLHAFYFKFFLSFVYFLFFNDSLQVARGFLVTFWARSSLPITQRGVGSIRTLQTEEPFPAFSRRRRETRGFAVVTGETLLAILLK